MNTTTKNSPFSAQGRISRITFFAWNTALSMVFAAIITAIFLLIPNLSEMVLNTFLTMDNIGLLILIFLIFYIPFMYFSYIFSIKRLHDLNQSGWLVCLNFVPLVNLALALYVMFAPGTTGPNNFGEQRAPKTWESVVTWIMIVLLSLSLIVVILAGVFMQST